MQLPPSRSWPARRLASALSLEVLRHGNHDRKGGFVDIGVIERKKNDNPVRRVFKPDLFNDAGRRPIPVRVRTDIASNS